MLNIDSQKMSKSLNNFFLVRDAAKKYGYEPLRFMLLSAHYRSQMNYTNEVLESSAKSVERLRNCVTLMNNYSGGKIAANKAEQYKKRFISEMDDDFNTADALAVLFELVRDINTAVNAGEDISEYRKVFGEINGVLGLLYAEEEAIPEEITALAEKRRAAKSVKDFVSADKIREEINALGYVIEETRQGVVIKRKI